MLKRSVQYLIAGLLTLPGLALAAESVQLPATKQMACFDANGHTIACAETGQDGDKQVGVAWPTPRFTNNGNGTLTDGLTGLILSRHANAPNRALANGQVNNCPNAESAMTWLQALDFIVCLNANNHAGFNDWRLPNLNELESLVNAGVADSSAWLNDNGFGFGPGLPKTQVQASQYWSSTSDAGDLASQSAASAWDVDLVKGDFPFSTLKNDPLLKRAVWPVRGVSNGPAPLWRTGQTLCYDEVGEVRPCTNTGEDGEHLAGVNWSGNRFKTNGDATFALDKLTGLVWTTATQSPGPPACADAGLNLNWQQALDYVACLNTNAFLGRSDWRLPNRKELHSLVDHSRGKAALITGHPFNDLAGLTYWSSTTNLTAPKEAWVVSMFNGSLSSAVKTGLLPVWPMSGPDLVAPTLTINQGDMLTNLATQTIDGTVNETATVKVSINGSTPANATVTGTTWSFTTTLASGANVITVTADDFSENLSTKSLTMTLDAAAPTLTLNPTTIRTNRKSQSLSGTVETGAIMTATMGGGSLPLTITGTRWDCQINVLTPGTNTVTINAVDSAGNMATQTVAITLIIPDGKLSGEAVSAVDALKALRMAVGLVSPSPDDLLHGDVFPQGAPDGRIEVNDALLILKKAIGMVNF